MNSLIRDVTINVFANLIASGVVVSAGYLGAVYLNLLPRNSVLFYAATICVAAVALYLSVFGVVACFEYLPTTFQRFFPRIVLYWALLAAFAFLVGVLILISEVVTLSWLRLVLLIIVGYFAVGAVGAIAAGIYLDIRGPSNADIEKERQREATERRLRIQAASPIRAHGRQPNGSRRRPTRSNMPTARGRAIRAPSRRRGWPEPR